jgi:hypothetical protein
MNIRLVLELDVDEGRALKKALILLENTRPQYDRVLPLLTEEEWG